MTAATASSWEDVLAQGCPAPPESERLEAATALVAAFSDPDRRTREVLAPTILSAWVGAGTFDDLLPGLGDGLLAGLTPARMSSPGMAEVDRDLALHGRCGRARALTAVLARDNAVHRVPREQLLTWADRSVTWLLHERDTRPATPHGPADAVARGAEVLASLAGSSRLGADELLVLLDVVSERAWAPSTVPLAPSQADALALAASAVLGRNLVGLEAAEGWVDRLSATAAGQAAPSGPEDFPRAGALAVLAALHTQLVLGVAGGTSTPRDRGDLVLAVQAGLRRAAPWLYRSPATDAVGRFDG